MPGDKRINLWLEAVTDVCEISCENLKVEAPDQGGIVKGKEYRYYKDDDQITFEYSPKYGRFH